MLKFKYLLIFLLGVNIADAKDFFVTNLASYHLNRDVAKRKDLNEVNPGVGFERDIGDNRYSVGVYDNSYNKNSLYGLLSYLPFKSGNFVLGITGGAATGYNKPLMPIVGLLGTYDTPKGGVSLILTPPVSYKGKHSYGVLGIQGRFPLK